MTFIDQCPLDVLLSVVFPMHREMVEGDIVTKCLQEHGPDQTMLMAVEDGKLSIVKRAVSEGATIVNNNKVYRLAVCGGVVDIVEYLYQLTQSTQSIQSTCATGKYIFRLAAYYGHLNIVQCFMSKVNSKDIDGALRWAYIKGHFHIVEYLKDRIDIQDFNCNASQWAIIRGKSCEIVFIGCDYEDVRR